MHHDVRLRGGPDQTSATVFASEGSTGHGVGREVRRREEGLVAETDAPEPVRTALPENSTILLDADRARLPVKGDVIRVERLCVSWRRL